MEQLAEKADLSISQVSKIENNKRGWSMASLEKLADALGVKVPELIDASDVWQQVPLFGVVEDGGVVSPSKQKGKKTIAHVRAPLAFGSLLALLVTNDSLYPRYFKNDVIFCTKDPAGPEGCLDRECLVTLENGVSMIRLVHAGTAKERYNLMSHNHAPQSNRAIVICRPVVYSTRP